MNAATIGRSKTPLDGPAKVRGRGRYAGDYQVPRLLHAAVLRSHVPHGELVGVKVAGDLPAGIHAVLDRTELGMDSRLRHYGDVVAAVVAETEEVAQRGVQALEADIMELPSVFDPLEAIGHSPPLFAEWPDNIAKEVSVELGRPDEALAGCDVVLRETYRMGRLTHCNLSRRCCIARGLEDGTLEVMTAVAAPFFARKELAQDLGLPEEQVQIVLPELSGSSFGGRSGICHLCEPLAARLALRVDGRPVRLLYSPVEEFVAGHTRHCVVAQVTAGATSDGRLQVLDVDLVADHASSPSFVAAIVLSNCCERPRDLFEVPHYRFRGRAVLTNNLPAGEMRGIGSTQIMYIIGSHVDELARKLGMEPLDFHRANVTSGGLTGCLERAAEAVAAWPPVQTEDASLQRRGIGMALGSHTTGLGTFHGNDSSRAVVRINGADGVQVAASAPDSGQGSATAYAQIAADELGIPYELVRVSNIDTALSPYDPWGSVASRGLHVVGAAVGAAARQARERLREAAQEVLGIAADDFEITDGCVFSTSDPKRQVAAVELADAVGGICEEAASETSSNPPTFGAYFAEVEVDVATGEVAVRRMVAVVDVGKALNPAQCRSQVEGAIAWGLESVVGSEIVLEDGVPANASFVDYRVARLSDMPEIDVILLESPEDSSPYGVRGLGTPALVPVLPAVCNAIRSACGVRVTDVPLRPGALL